MPSITKGYNPETDSWHCTVCGVDMGSMNPRQLCMKTYCENEIADSKSVRPILPQPMRRTRTIIAPTNKIPLQKQVLPMNQETTPVPESYDMLDYLA
jgi:hypothetical protein